MFSSSFYVIIAQLLQDYYASHGFNLTFVV